MTGSCLPGLGSPFSSSAERSVSRSKDLVDLRTTSFHQALFPSFLSAPCAPVTNSDFYQKKPAATHSKLKKGLH